MIKSVFRTDDVPVADRLPCDCETVDSRQPAIPLGIEIPKAFLKPAGNGADEVLGRQLPGHSGAGALLTQFLTHLTGEADVLRQANGPQLASVLLDLVSALFAHQPPAKDLPTPETRRRTLVLRIRAFILQHLADPDLTPRSIAAAHHISTSYLHRLFQQEDDTVASWIRRQRLERARSDLTDPAHRTVPIYSIAARWGFSRAADFTRAFRTAYGVPPKDYRRHAKSTLV
ncbi:helix-turn-helix domain-containing protein [Streptomyces sp. 8N114]|uniref:helix-turn-helix domain-containing protein n=1 Tax=Streptomyces sp. 8N114 TaxID=3457419 RepID=UPI003FD02D76